MQILLQDIRHAARRLVRQRGTSVVEALTLALGIGASTAIFSVVGAAMLRPLPYSDPEQLVAVYAEVTRPDGRSSLPSPAMADMRLWQQADAVFSAVAGWAAPSAAGSWRAPSPRASRSCSSPRPTCRCTVSRRSSAGTSPATTPSSARRPSRSSATASGRAASPAGGT